VILAIAALLSFVQDLVFGLSIKVKAALLVFGFVGFFVVGTATDRDVLDAVAFALSGAAYLVFLAYVIWRYSVGETGTFLLLALSAGLFIGLGYLLRECGPRTPVRVAGYVVGGLLLVSVALVGVDAAGGGVTYDLQTNESVTVEAPDWDHAPEAGYAPVDVRLGTVTAENEFVFRRALDLPALSGCVVGTDAPDERWAYLDYDDASYQRPAAIGGGQSLTFGVRAEVPVPVNATQPVDFAVEQRSACPDDADRATIVVTADGDLR
jgi:hypothetical protein